MGFHANTTPERGIHGIVRWTFADASARAAGTQTIGEPAVTLTVLGETLVAPIALQIDTNELYWLLSEGPLVWQPVGNAALAINKDKVEIDAIKDTAGTLAVGSLVYVADHDDVTPIVQVEAARSNSTSTMPALGMVSEEVTNLVAGKIMIVGKVFGLNTSSIAKRAALFVSSSAAGSFTSIAPIGPNIRQQIGIVIDDDASNGVVWVGIDSVVPLSDSGPSNVSRTAAGSGTSADVSRADHKHDIATAAAINVGAANQEGSSSSLARADHTHAVTNLSIASEAQGDILYRNASSWVRLPAGTSGQVLQTNGAAANPSWETAASGANNIVLDEHWLTGADDTDEVGQISWTLLAGGTGADVLFTGEAGHPGIVDMGGGKAAGSRSALYAVAPAFDFSATQNTIVWKHIVKFDANGLDSTHTERVTWGWGDEYGAVGGVQHANGIYIDFDPAVSGNLRLSCANGGTRTTVTGTTVMVADTWYRVEMTVTFGPAASVQMSVNGGNEGAAVSTNIPAGPVAFGQRIDGVGSGTEGRFKNDRILITQISAEED